MLNVREQRKEVLLGAIEAEEPVAEAVPEFLHSRNFPLICFVSFEPGFITHLATGRRGRRAGTRIRRLNLARIVALHAPIPVASAIAGVSARVRRTVTQRFRQGGILPPKSFSSVVESLRQISGQAREYLNRFSEQRTRQIERIPVRSRVSLGYQKEAVATALAISRIDPAVLQQWEPSAQTGSASFLDGLPSVRNREDAIVISDLHQVPGFDFVHDMPYGAAVFQNDRVRLTVVVANHLPLEEQTGADLIYFNETYRSFVCVQYKMMDRSAIDGAFFRLPDAQLTEEVNRMRSILDLMNQCEANQEADGYRLLENPFFLKFCPRVTFDPDHIGLSKGMYIPLDYWTLIESGASTLGPRGGRRIDFQNMQRYFTNSQFMSVVENAWIGTNAAQSRVLEEVIRNVVIQGRAVVLAMRTDSSPWPRSSIESDDQDFFD